MDNFDTATGTGSSDVKYIIDKLDLTGATAAEIAEQVLKPITSAAPTASHGRRSTKVSILKASKAKFRIKYAIALVRDCEALPIVKK